MGKIQRAREVGYKIQGVYVTIPTQVAVDRVRARTEATGRPVALDTGLKTNAGMSRVVSHVASSIDTFRLFDTNNAGAPTLVASATRQED
jgi:predicted ABC-type ATPase